MFTETSIANILDAAQAGMGLSFLLKGALKDGLRKAPSSLKLPELPMNSIVLNTCEQQTHDAGYVFTSYLEADIDKIG